MLAAGASGPGGVTVESCCSFLSVTRGFTVLPYLVIATLCLGLVGCGSNGRGSSGNPLQGLSEKEQRAANVNLDRQGSLDTNEKQSQKDLSIASDAPNNEPSQIAIANTNGKNIATRLEQECDYWGIDRYNSDGTATISKSIYTNWGGKQVMMIPRASWNALSIGDRSDLANYVSEDRGVTSIIVGEVRPSEKFNRNTITVDESVWP